MLTREKASYSKLRSQALLARVKNLQHSISHRTASQQPASHSHQKPIKVPKEQLADISNVSSLSISSPTPSLQDLEEDNPDFTPAKLDKNKSPLAHKKMVKNALPKPLSVAEISSDTANSQELLNRQTSFRPEGKSQQSSTILSSFSTNKIDTIDNIESRSNAVSANSNFDVKKTNSDKLSDAPNESLSIEDLIQVLPHEASFLGGSVEGSIEQQSLQGDNSIISEMPFKVEMLEKSLPSSSYKGSHSEDSNVLDVLPRSPSPHISNAKSEKTNLSKTDLFRVFSPNHGSIKSFHDTPPSEIIKSNDSTGNLQEEYTHYFESLSSSHIFSYKEDFVNSSSEIPALSSHAAPLDIDNLISNSNKENILDATLNGRNEICLSSPKGDSIKISLEQTLKKTSSKYSDSSQNIPEESMANEISSQKQLDSSLNLVPDIPLDKSDNSNTNQHPNYSLSKDSDLLLSHLKSSSSKNKVQDHLSRDKTFVTPNKSLMVGSPEKFKSTSRDFGLQPDHFSLLKDAMTEPYPERQNKLTQTDLLKTEIGPQYIGSLYPPGGKVKGSVKELLIQEVTSLEHWVAMRKNVHAASQASLHPNYHYTTTWTLQKELKRKKTKKLNS